GVYRPRGSLRGFQRTLHCDLRIGRPGAGWREAWSLWRTRAVRHRQPSARSRTPGSNGTASRCRLARTLDNELHHVRPVTDAMERKDLEAMLSHMTEDIVLETPLLAEPVRGKGALRTVVGALLAIVDSFDFQELMQGPSHVASFFVVRIGAERLDGMDYWLL